MAPVQLKLSGDPRRPAEARKYERPRVNLEEEPPSMFLLMGLALGLLSLVFKAKLPAWGSLLLCLCGVANAKSGHADVKQFISSLTFAVFGLVSSYLMPIGRRAAEAAAEAASAGAASELPVA
ncbi:Asterix [Micractinium conductrix]|uniref:Asterix n=1 Tax=Micractinium conductrix TaxID=554055 RepID=A0A2P6VLB0_9CHLO|nr:Asterix [Micractinium conductrix]|eukprot:PSC74881.1 Asterix [Micractinium conductrix]